MNWERLFNPQGINWWIIVSGIGLNFLLTLFMMFGITYATTQEAAPAVYTTMMSVGGFVIPLLTAYVCGRIGDERFLAYGFYPLVGYLILAVPGIPTGGIFGVLMVVFGVLGAFNGAMLAARRANRRRHYTGPDD